MKPSGKTGPNGIKEIAGALGISIGTVDRALHDRRGVSPSTRDRVLKMAQKLSYSPNIAARSLKLSRKIRVGVYLPRQIASYYDVLREGIRAAADAETGITIELSFFDYKTLGEGDLEIMKKSDWLAFDGIILAPGRPSQMSEISNMAAGRQKPLVCVTTDAPRMNCLASITADSYVSGAIAAELLGGWITKSGVVAMFTGDLRVQDHADKLRGFAATLATSFSHLTLFPAVESHDSFNEAYTSAQKILREQPQLAGIYINTANSLPILRAMREANRVSQVKIVTTDLYAELIPFIESGEVNASLYQRPFTQGKLALELLCAYLGRGVRPKPSTRLAPHIILKSNLSLFLDSLDRQNGGISTF